MHCDHGMNIPLFVNEPTGIDRSQEVVLGGIPIPKGALTAGGWFHLRNKDGDEFLVEGHPGAWWPDRSVKWLHLCGAVDLKGGGRNALVLEPTEEIPEQQLAIDQSDGQASIRGGALNVDVRADASDMLSVSWADAPSRALLKPPGLSGALVLVGPDGENRRTYPLSLDGAETEIAVQTANRVVVRLAGRFGEEDGEPVSELLLFLEAFRQSPEIRLQPVFIYRGVPETDLVASLELTVHTASQGDDCRYGFANERGRGYWDVMQRVEDGPRWPQARQVQLGASFFKTEKRTGPEGSWVKAVEGQRSQGWCHLGGPDGGVTAATRYFWQEYPRSYSIDADAGTITFGLWPSAAEPLDLRRYSPVIYGAPVYEYCPRTAVDGKFPSEMGASGIAKAHELMLRFHKEDREDAPRRGLFFAQPCRVIPDPSQLAETKAIGHLVPTDPPRDSRIEAKVEELIDFLINERGVRGWFGQLNFGDMMIAYYSDIDRWAFDDGGYAWINTEHLPDYGLWITALRSGRPDWLDAAIEMSRHNRDVDMYHRGHLIGHGSRHNVNHWGCADKEWRVSMPLARRLHYYLTADPWTAEAIRSTIAVFQSYERTAKIAPSMTSALAGLMVKWEMSGDPADGEPVRNMADLYSLAFREDGLMIRNLHADLATGVGEPVEEETIGSYFFMNGFGGQHTLVEVAELLEHDALSEAMERYVRMCLRESEYPGGVVMFMAHVYRRTGDETLRDAIRGCLDKINVELGEAGGEGPLDDPKHLVLPNFTRKNKIACHIGGDVLHLTPYGMAVLEE